MANSIKPGRLIAGLIIGLAVSPLEASYAQTQPQSGLGPAGAPAGPLAPTPIKENPSTPPAAIPRDQVLAVRITAATISAAARTSFTHALPVLSYSMGLLLAPSPMPAKAVIARYPAPPAMTPASPAHHTVVVLYVPADSLRSTSLPASPHAGTPVPTQHAPTRQLPPAITASSPAASPSLLAAPAGPPRFVLASLNLTATDRDALGRVAFAEAGNQTEEGIAAVTYAILNRLEAGRFGSNVEDILDAPNQFEPVTNAGGAWSNLPALSPGQIVEFNTILDLILEDRLPDPTNGALYFQNATIVAERAAAGEVSPTLVNFGGQTPTTTIRDQSFYAGISLDGLQITPQGQVISGSLGMAPQRLAPIPPVFKDGNAPALFAPLAGSGATPAGLFVPLGMPAAGGVTTDAGIPPAAPGRPDVRMPAPVVSTASLTPADATGSIFESNTVPQITTNPIASSPSPGAIDTPAPGVAGPGVVPTSVPSGAAGAVTHQQS